MAVKLRLMRMGRRHRPFFRINAVESRVPRDGRIIEKLGHYDPIEKDQEKQVVLNHERVQYWLDKGAIPSDAVSELLLRRGIKHKYAEEKSARCARAKAFARAKGRPFNKAERIAAERAAKGIAEAEEAKAKAEAQAKAKHEAEEKAKAEAQAKAKHEAEEKAKAEAQAKAKHEAEEKAKAEAIAKAKDEAVVEKPATKPEAEEKPEPQAKAEAEADAEPQAEGQPVEEKVETEPQTKPKAEEKSRPVRIKKSTKKTEGEDETKAQE
jgi:ribosomal protein S16